MLASEVVPVPARRSKARALAQSSAPWLSLLLVWFLFEIPTALQSDAIEPKALRPSLDVLALFTLWGLSQRHLQQPWLRRGLTAITWLLVAFRLDQMVFKLLARDEPLLYDQWFMVRHLIVLISDLMSVTTLLVVGGVVLAVIALALLSRLLLRRAHPLFTPARERNTFRVFFAAWGLALVATFVSFGDKRVLVRWLTPALCQNVASSVATYRSIQRGLSASPYANYEHVELKDKPDVLLFIVESYGRLLSDHDTMKKRHASLLEGLEGRLETAGWHSVSAFGTSSVSGARSWLAEGTIMMGTPIKYEAVFHHLVSQQPPSFPRFLARQGYETVLLAPSDRNRIGARLANRYSFSRILSNEVVGYKGPAMGWGIVPDQYSLAVAERRVLQKRERPVFLDFHMVTSHAPWNAIPPLVDDVAALNQLDEHYKTVEESSDPSAQVRKRLSRYQRDDGATFAYMGRLTGPMRRAYQATINYDLEVITRYLESRKDDAFVVILGDHQPPVITRDNASFDTPIHVLSRSPHRLTELLHQGFTAGLAIDGKAQPALSHAGLFSLFVRTLAASDSPIALPPVLAQGQPLL